MFVKSAVIMSDANNAMSAKPAILAFFDAPANSVSYLVWDTATMQGGVIDPVLDFDQRSGNATVAKIMRKEPPQLQLRTFT